MKLQKAVYSKKEKKVSVCSTSGVSQEPYEVQGQLPAQGEGTENKGEQNTEFKTQKVTMVIGRSTTEFEEKKVTPGDLSPSVTTFIANAPEGRRRKQALLVETEVFKYVPKGKTEPEEGVKLTVLSESQEGSKLDSFSMDVDEYAVWFPAGQVQSWLEKLRPLPVDVVIETMPGKKSKTHLMDFFYLSEINPNKDSLGENA